MGKYVRLAAVLLAVAIAIIPHLSESLAKFNSPWVKATAAALAVISATFMNALKVPLFSQILELFLKRAGVDKLSDLIDDKKKELEALEKKKEEKVAAVEAKKEEKVVAIDANKEG